MNQQSIRFLQKMRNFRDLRLRTGLYPNLLAPDLATLKIDEYYSTY